MKKISKLLVFLLVITSLFALVSCSDDNKGDKEYNSITSSCTLSKKYDGKDFFTDGIEKATLERAADGDTASFRLESGKFVTIRFYGVDTPESSGGVEKWGKAASLFTLRKLEAASEIVLEGADNPPKVDSYGSRYLGYVWAKDAKTSKWINLNLLLVENGYSKNNCSTDYSYYQTFKKAEQFAKNKPLHIWDDDAIDHLFSDEPIKATIHDLVDNIDAYYNEETSSGSKVQFEAYLKDVTISGTGTYTYTAAQTIDGVEKTFNIYTAYASNTINTFIRIGHLYQITGTIQKYNGNYQISGIKFVAGQSGGEYLTTIKSEYYLTFNSEIAFIGIYGKALYSDATITAAAIDGENVKITASAKQNSKNGYAEEITTFEFIVKNTNNLTDASSLVGKTFSGGGLQESSKVITVNSYSDLVIK